MQRTSELSLEQIEQMLLSMDWVEIEKQRVFGDYGDSVVIHTDGSTSIQGQSTYYRDPDAARVITYLKCWGMGNTDCASYLEGWTERREDGSYVDTVDGTVYEDDHAAMEAAIEFGDLDPFEYIDPIMQDLYQERDYEEERANRSLNPEN